MTWLTPSVGLIAAAIAVPALLLLYFLKLRRREVEVSSTLLWRRAIRDLRANAPFQRLRRNLLLLLQLLALAAAFLAVAQPELPGSAPLRGRTVLLIDRSASMAATDADGTDRGHASRLSLARAQALALVDSLPSRGIFGAGDSFEAMVIAFDSGAEVVHPFTSDKARLRRAIEAIEPTDTPSSFEEASRLASAQIGDGQGDTGAAPDASIFLLSDGVIPNLDRVTLPSEAPLMYRSVGSESAPNLALISMRHDRAFGNTSSASIYVGIQSTDERPRTADVQLSVNGLVVAAREVSLPAAVAEQGRSVPATGGLVFTLERAEGAIVQADLLVDDALESDNTAALVLPPARSLSVAIVTQGSLFLQAALQGLPLARLDVLTPDDFSTMTHGSGAHPYDVVVLDGWVPVPALREAPSDESVPPRAGEAFPPGNYLILGAVPRLPGLTQRGELDQPSIVLDWERAHPALEYVNLDPIVLASPIAMQSTSDARVLAHAAHGPVIVEATDGAVRAIVVGFAPAKSNWPFDPGFVLFLAASVRYLGDAYETASGSSLQTGSTLITQLPSGVSSVRLRSPTGERIELHPADDGTVAYGPIRRTGVYELRWSGPAGPTDLRDGRESVRHFAANLFDSEESNLGAIPSLDFATGTVTGSLGSGERGATRRLWPWILAACLCLLLLEWYVYNRGLNL